jgi:tetraacyldisaccharide 4'-kinase
MLKDEVLGIAQLKEKTIFAFCGVGNPDAFLNRLREFALNVIGSKVYNDHHDYSQADITNIHEEAKNLGADLILSTQKDWVKTALLSQQNDDILFAYLAVELEFIDGADKIEALVDKAIAKQMDD